MASTHVDTLSLRFGLDDGTVVVHVTGEVDASTAPTLRTALESVIDDQGNLSVRLELGGMRFIDSAGLIVLLGASTRLRARNGRMILANPVPSARRALETAGLIEEVSDQN